ncbi:MAG TPA: DUF559 domain-containing protein [Niabella sp.]
MDPIHLKEDVKTNDLVRQQALEDDGLKMLRFTNDEVGKYLEELITKIE